MSYSKANSKVKQNRRVSSKRRIARSVSEAKVHINASYNNVIVTITDVFGKVLCFASAGSCGFSGGKKKTNLAASIVAKTATKKAVDVFGVKHFKVCKKGVGKSGDAAVMGVSSALDPSVARIVELDDITTIPHGGCQQRKRKHG